MHKNRPAWQDGLINGLGGKVEEVEDTFTTISREIEEESGLKIKESEWIKSGKVYSGTFTMDVFGCVYGGGKEDAKTKEDEEIEWFSISALPPNTVENIPWLVHITLDKIKNNNFKQFEVQYKK